MTDSGPAMDDEVQIDEKGKSKSLQVEIDELRRIVCDLLYKNELLRMRLGLVQDSEICQA
jgi:hypothetical protein